MTTQHVCVNCRDRSIYIFGYKLKGRESYTFKIDEDALKHQTEFPNHKIIVKYVDEDIIHDSKRT